MLVCPKCGNKFGDKFIIKSLSNGKTCCPIIGCHDILIDVPENLVETIILLNKKGYKTKFCNCSKMDDSPEFDLSITFDKILVADIESERNPFFNLKYPQNVFQLTYEKMRFKNNDKQTDNLYRCPKISLSPAEKEKLQKLFSDENFKDDIVTLKFNNATDYFVKLYKWAKKLPKLEGENVTNEVSQCSEQ